MLANWTRKMTHKKEKEKNKGEKEVEEKEYLKRYRREKIIIKQI